MRFLFFFTLWCTFLWGLAWYVHEGFQMIWAYNGALAVLAAPVLICYGSWVSRQKWGGDS